MYEDIVPDWSRVSTGDLLCIRYREGVRLRRGLPFPSYSYGAYTVGANRVLDSRLGMFE